MNRDKMLSIAMFCGILIAAFAFSLCTRITPGVQFASTLAMMFCGMIVMLMNGLTFFVTFILAASLHINIGRLTPVILALPSCLVANYVLTVPVLVGFRLMAIPTGMLSWPAVVGVAVLSASTYIALVVGFVAVQYLLYFIEEKVYCLKMKLKERAKK